MDYSKTRKDYVDVTTKYLKDGWKIEPSFHLCDVIADVLMQRDGVIAHGGHFVQAVLNNDLRGCIDRADHEIQTNLKYVVASIINLPTPAVRVRQTSYNLVENE